MSAVLDRDRTVAGVDLAGLADELLGPRRGSARSPTWRCPSPHPAQTGRTPPVSIFRGRSGEERWHCHGCGMGGTAIDLVMVVRGFPVREAIEQLAGRVGVREAAGIRSRKAPRSDASPTVDPSRPVADQEGLTAFVDECAARLWTPAGAPVRQWLTETRGIPEDVLRANRIGADPGRRRQRRPDGMPSAGRAAVLPVLQEGRPVFAQLRVIAPLEGRPRYLNASARLAVNPRVGMFQPAEPVGQCVIVTEGILDALSANSASFRAVAVLGAGLASPGSEWTSNKLADRLARRGAPLIVALDADDAGERAASELIAQLRELESSVVRLNVPETSEDLNGWMLDAADWPRTLRSAVRSAILDVRTRQPPRR